MKRIFLVLLTALAISCGDNKKEKTSEVKIGSQVEETTPVKSENDSITEVSITGNDQMKYNKTEIRVKAGQKVKLTLTHVGKMDKNVMGHDWVLLTKDADMATVGNASAAAGDKDGVPAEMADKIIANTKMLGGGQSDTIEFDAPPAGTYTFMCTFPGHYVTMNGKFIVE